jgi:hypothetical protein
MNATPGQAQFLGYLDMPLFTPPWAPVTALTTYPDTQNGWLFVPNCPYAMPAANNHVASGTNGALLRVMGCIFGSPFTAPTPAFSLLNPTSGAPGGVGTGMNYFNNRLALSTGFGGMFEEVSFYPDLGTTTPFTPPYSPVPGTFPNIIPYNTPFLVRAVTGFNMRLVRGISGETPQIFVYMLEPLLGTESQAYQISQNVSFEFAGAPQLANNFNLTNLQDFSNRLFKGANAFGGPYLMIWYDGFPNFAMGPYGVSFTSHPAFDTFINTSGGDYVVNFATNGFVFTFRTNGAGPTGQHQEVVVTNIDMTQYGIVRWHPQDATAKAQMSRGPWSAMSDLNGVVWFNSGNSADAAYPLASITQLPWTLPSQFIPFSLPCEQPCPAIP